MIAKFKIINFMEDHSPAEQITVFAPMLYLTNVETPCMASLPMHGVSTNAWRLHPCMASLRVVIGYSLLTRIVWQQKMLKRAL
ncbi:MAG: hypothetical protein ABI863_07220 [Ginsengibacter sp.]